MSRDAFAKRERGLENEFFHRVDQELMHRLQEKAEQDEGRTKLSQVTGIGDRAVLDELLEAGIRAETLVAFSLVPMIRVAFADRVLDSAERDVVLQAAETIGVTSETASYQLLSSWLSREPDERLFDVWKDYIRALGHVATPNSLRHLQETVTQRAREIATATGGFLGIHKASDVQKAAIDEIEKTFDEAARL